MSENNTENVPSTAEGQSELIGLVISRSGLFDKNGREICLGDTIEINRPYRSTQTHYGENIPGPTGEYTEPLEPEIKTERFVVKFGGGMFHVDEIEGIDKDDFLTPLSWKIYDFETKDELIDAFGGITNTWMDKDCQGEDDLGYLLSEYPPNTEDELMAYISGCEVVEI